VAVLCDGDEVPNRVKFHGLNDRNFDGECDGTLGLYNLCM
jgi:hypothetical protein